MRIKRIIVLPLIGILLILVACTKSVTTPTLPTPVPTEAPSANINNLKQQNVVQSSSDADRAVWAHISTLTQNSHGKISYQSVHENICTEYLTSCNDKDWWHGAKDCWYYALEIYIDSESGKSLLPPDALISTVVATGRKVVYFGWIIEPDGTVYAYNPYAKWFEEMLKD